MTGPTFVSGPSPIPSCDIVKLRRPLEIDNDSPYLRVRILLPAIGVEGSGLTRTPYRNVPTRSRNNIISTGLRLILTGPFSSTPSCRSLEIGNDSMYLKVCIFFISDRNRNNMHPIALLGALQGAVH